MSRSRSRGRNLAALGRRLCRAARLLLPTAALPDDSLGGLHMAAQAADADGITVLEAEPAAPIQSTGN